MGWAEGETDGANLPDARLKRRLTRVGTVERAADGEYSSGERDVGRHESGLSVI